MPEPSNDSLAPGSGVKGGNGANAEAARSNGSSASLGSPITAAEIVAHKTGNEKV